MHRIQSVLHCRLQFQVGPDQELPLAAAIVNTGAEPTLEQNQVVSLSVSSRLIVIPVTRL